MHICQGTQVMIILFLIEIAIMNKEDHIIALEENICAEGAERKKCCAMSTKIWVYRDLSYGKISGSVVIEPRTLEICYIISQNDSTHNHYTKRA